MLFFLMLAVLYGSGQTCTITASSYKVCLGSSVSFTVSSNGTITKTNWSFGDGNTDTLLAPSHVYNSPGNYTVQVIVLFSNNQRCTTSVTQPVKVFDLPKSNFTLSVKDTMCISSQLCLTNTSTPGSTGAPIHKASFLFGDGTPVTNNNTPCHYYAKAGAYIISLEVEDTNGCIARIEKPFVVVEDVKTAILMSYSNCGPVRFINASNMSQALTKRFYWDFGDGTFDSTNFSLAFHTYTDKTKCPFKAKLYIESKYGCWDDTFVTVCPFVYFNLKIQGDKKKTCYNGNLFNYTSTGSNPGALYSWAAKELGSATAVAGGVGLNYSFHFTYCGKFVVYLYLRNGFCDTTVYDTVEVLGPQARIQTDSSAPFNVINRYQCSPNDTVFFVSPTLYQSNHCSASIRRLWDFGDLNCPQCTTDTKNGVYPGSNCRWSKDSLNVKHKYSDTGCYLVKLLLVDTITGCSDTDQTYIVIQKPDLSALKVIGRACLNENQLVNFNRVKPSCGAQEFWFNPDTNCYPSLSRLPFKNFYYMNFKLCNGNKIVSEFVLRNGNCYDTFYYTRTIQRLTSAFDLIKSRGCVPTTIRTFMHDSVQSTVTRAVWDWGDSTKTYDTLITGGKITSQTHTYLKAGVYDITLQLYDTTRPSQEYPHVGCIFDTTYTISIGYYKDFSIDANPCSRKNITFIDSVFYYNDPYNPSFPFSSYKWGSSGREKIYWFFGDGSIDSGSNPVHTYAKAGAYKVSMVTIDSLGCIDSASRLIRINDFVGNFTWKPTVLVCGQIVQFTDSSYIIDSSGITPADKIVWWDWDFGDNRIHSSLQNPAHPYFVYGTFNVTLIVKTLRGCVDTVVKQIYIDGPQPKFEFITDTVGCFPYTIKLRNLSVGCQKNIIYMGDAGNTNFLLKAGDTLTFTYALPGIYYIYLFGEATILNPNTGNTVYCSAWFPEKNNPKAKLMRVVVLPRPKVAFNAPDTVCVNTPFTLNNTSDKIYQSYHWEFGDSTAKDKNRPDTNTTHTYTKTGVYRILLKPDYPPPANSKACPDTFSRRIVVADIKAGFQMDSSGMPLIRFKNTSVLADNYYWDFGHPASGSANKSRLQNPEHDFLNDTGTFDVCLLVTNRFGCRDSVCQSIRNTAYKLLVVPNVFTINNDGVNDAFDIFIHGGTYYNLVIYNRWGESVYQSTKDGTDNDGINWNGKVNNTGSECMEGVYYVVLKYRFRGDDETRTYKGTVTLIRN